MSYAVSSLHSLLTAAGVCAYLHKARRDTSHKCSPELIEELLLHLSPGRPFQLQPLMQQPHVCRAHQVLAVSRSIAIVQCKAVMKWQFEQQESSSKATHLFQSVPTWHLVNHACLVETERAENRFSSLSDGLASRGAHKIILLRVPCVLLLCLLLCTALRRPVSSLCSCLVSMFRAMKE